MLLKVIDVSKKLSVFPPSLMFVSFFSPASPATIAKLNPSLLLVGSFLKYFFGEGEREKRLEEQKNTANEINISSAVSFFKGTR